MTPAIIVALLASSASLITAVVTAISSHLARSRADARLALLAAKLQDQAELVRAQREYELEARKRLYRDLSPLFFQMQEAMLSQRMRVLTTVKYGRLGQLGSGENSLVSVRGIKIDPYFTRSTIYRLILPVSIGLLIQRRLTSLDLRLDAVLRWQYVLTHAYKAALTSGPELALLPPVIDYHYTPNVTPLGEKQSFSGGRVEQFAESLIIQDSETGRRVMSYSEFENALIDPASNVGLYSRRFAERLSNFLPSERPVLWRIFLITALLADLFSSSAESGEVRGLESISLDLAAWDWRPERPDDSESSEVLAAQSWLADILAHERPSVVE